MGWRAQVGLLAPAGGAHFSPLTPPTKGITDSDGEWQGSVISSVLSHHNKNLKRQTSFTALGWTSVIAQFYLESKGKYLLET